MVIGIKKRFHKFVRIFFFEFLLEATKCIISMHNPSLVKKSVRMRMILLRTEAKDL